MTREQYKRTHWARRFMDRWQAARAKYDETKAYPWASPSFLSTPVRGGYWVLWGAEWSLACEAIWAAGESFQVPKPGMDWLTVPAWQVKADLLLADGLGAHDYVGRVRVGTRNLPADRQYRQ